VAQQLIKRSDGKGRYPAIEVMLNTPLIADIIRKGEVHRLKEVMKAGKEAGMQTFDQSLFDLYRAGKISYDDALNSADSRNEVRLAIKLASESGNVFSSEDEAMTLAMVDEKAGGTFIR
jgi:twitching motility protein PilU